MLMSRVKNNLKNESKYYILKWIICFSIMLFSVGLLVIQTGFNPNCMYANDNAVQWGPIIECAYRYFFSTGKIAYWNFYDYKGIDIFSQGYYSIDNPFMLLAYIIARCFEIFNSSVPAV